MTTPRSQLNNWSHNRVISLLLELAAQLQELDAELTGLEEDAIDKAETLNAERTTAFLKAEGPQYLREAIADDATAELRLASRIADAMVRAQRRKVEILRERIGIGRTVVASLRAELALEKS